MKASQHHIRTTAAVALALSALAAPAASARPATLDPITPPHVQALTPAARFERSNPPENFAAAEPASSRAAPSAGSDSFSWGDGAIGGATVLVLMGIGVTAATSAGKRGTGRRTGTTTTTT